ncbi:unnamed protein product, partial [Amoebophrya sp. A25]
QSLTSSKVVDDSFGVANFFQTRFLKTNRPSSEQRENFLAGLTIADCNEIQTVVKNFVT